MKTTTKGFCISALALFLALVTVLCVIFAMKTKSESASRICPEATVTADEKAKVDIVVSAESTCAIICGSNASIKSDFELAYELSGKILNGSTGLDIQPQIDSETEEQKCEILLANTNRAFSSELLAEISKVGSSDEVLVWGYAYKDGKLAYTANSNTAFNLGKDEFLALLSEDGTLSVDADLFVINSMTMADYEKESRQQVINGLIEENNKFTQDQFGGEPKDMPTNSYKSPAYYPVEGQHPRLFFTEDKIDEIYDNLLNNPDFNELRERFWQYANAENFTGIFPEQFKNGVSYRFNTTVLAQLEAKALAYILTGDEIYGYEAIIGAKNVMLSLHYIQELHNDTYHGASQVMVNVAKVYDWCYDLLTEDDKNQIIAGVCNVLAPQLEKGMQFPPSGMNGVSGHGTGPQFTRDWVTISLAFYDEVPSWWEFVGGRYFQEYVPVIDYCYQGGYASQGTTTYGDSKYFTKGWAAWLIKTSTGEFPYVENFHLGAYYYFSHLQANGYYFQTGDGGRSPIGCAVDPCYMFISAALFDDPVIANMAKKYTNNYNKFSYAFTMEYTVCDVLIWHTYGPDLNEYKEEDLKIDLIQYLDYPSGTMTARNTWDEDGAVALMRIGQMTMANHDLNDHGTFQIYYKGLLAGTSGAYKKYGSYVHKYYLQATVAHNGLLVFDPALADAEPKYGTKDPCGEEGCDHTECIIDYSTITNAERYYYSGGQRDRAEAGTIDVWLSGEYNMADVYGADWGYRNDGSAEYAYIAGDLTQAYPSQTVKYLGRKMLTVFTDDPNYPMLFFTYDQMTSVEGGENFTKTFLLHTVNQPEIDEENLTAVVTADQGRLFVHSLFGAQSISKIGGDGYAYWVNGKNCVDVYSPTDNSDVIWGRIELTAKGNLSDSFLTAMYVSDATNDQPLEVGKFSSDFVEGAIIKDNIIAFTKTDANGQQYKSFSFTTEGKGLYTYYVAGVEPGTWSVKVDGVTVAAAYADEGESIIKFVAPTGNITIVPGSDVIGANGGKIKYNTLGGMLPDGTPYSYNNESATPLPKNVTRGNDIFVGWYTTSHYDPETLITEIPAGQVGNIIIYARYISTLVDVDFKNPAFTLNLVEANQSKKLTFQAKSKTGASFITKTDDNGVQYLEWIEGSKDPLIQHTSKTLNYANMNCDDECVTYTITLSKNGNETMMASTFRTYTKKTVSGGSATTRLYIFNTTTDGEVRLGKTASGPLVTTLTSEPTTLKIVMDFKGEEIRAFDEDGNPLASLKVSVDPKSEAANMSEWRKLLDSYLLYWYADSPADANASMRIYDIKIEESDRVAAMRPENAILYSYGGSILPDDAPTQYSKETPTKLPIPTLDGYSFAGWYTTPGFNEGTLVTEVPTDTVGAFTVYAKWEKLPDNNSDINYNLGDGTLPEGAPTQYSKDTPTVLPIPTLGGYSFEGWYTTSGFDEGTLVTEVPTDAVGPFTVYAKWEKLADNNSDINYNLGGGTLPEGAPAQYSKDTPTVLPIPTLDGYSFEGWYTTPGFDEGTLVTEVPTDTVGLFIIYAKWEKLPDNGKINYNLGGGTLPEGAPERFESDKATVLPTPVKESKEFKGWYTDPSFKAETLVTEIPEGTEGEFTVYARWISVVFEEDYSESVVNIAETNKKVNQITYKANGISGASFKTEIDESKNKYLVWTNGEEDPIIDLSQGYISNMSDTLVSYEIRFARNGDAPLMQTSASARAQYDVNGTKLSSSAKINLFNTAKNGNVYLGSTAATAVGTIPADGSEFVLRLLIDFTNLTIYAYKDDGTVVSEAFTIPANTGAKTGAEYQKLFTTYTLYWQGSTKNTEEGASMRVEGIKLAEGNIFV